MAIVSSRLICVSFVFFFNIFPTVLHIWLNLLSFISKFLFSNTSILIFYSRSIKWLCCAVDFSFMLIFYFTGQFPLKAISYIPLAENVKFNLWEEVWPVLGYCRLYDVLVISLVRFKSLLNIQNYGHKFILFQFISPSKRGLTVETRPKYYTSWSSDTMGNNCAVVTVAREFNGVTSSPTS